MRSALGRAVVPVAMAGALLPASAHGQECFDALRDGQLGVGAAATFSLDGNTGYGPEVDYHTGRLLALGAGFSIIDDDDAGESWKEVGGSLRIEIPGLGFGLCPWAGTRYRWIELSGAEGTADLSALEIPVGLAMGKAFEIGEGAWFIPSARAAALWLRRKGSVSGFGLEPATDRDTATEFEGTLRWTLRIGRVYAAVGTRLTTVEGSEPGLTIRFGYLLR